MPVWRLLLQGTKLRSCFRRSVSQCELSEFSQEAVDEANKIIRDPNYKPEKEITLSSTMVTPDNAKELYEKLTVATDETSK